MARSTTATAAWPRSPDSHGSPQSQVLQQHARLMRCSTPPADSLHNTLFAAIRHRFEQQDSSSQCVLSSSIVETLSAACSSVSNSMPIVRPSAQAWRSSEGSGFAGNISNNYKFTHTFKLCRIYLNTNENKHYNFWSWFLQWVWRHFIATHLCHLCHRLTVFPSRQLLTHKLSAMPQMSHQLHSEQTCSRQCCVTFAVFLRQTQTFPATQINNSTTIHCSYNAHQVTVPVLAPPC